MNAFAIQATAAQPPVAVSPTEEDRAELSLLLKKIAQKRLLLLPYQVQNTLQQQFIHHISKLSTNDGEAFARKRAFVNWFSEMVLIDYLPFYQQPELVNLAYDLFKSYYDNGWVNNLSKHHNLPITRYTKLELYCQIANVIAQYYEKMGFDAKPAIADSSCIRHFALFTGFGLAIPFFQQLNRVPKWNDDYIQKVRKVYRFAKIAIAESETNDTCKLALYVYTHLIQQNNDLCDDLNEGEMFDFLQLFAQNMATQLLVDGCLRSEKNIHLSVALSFYFEIWLRIALLNGAVKVGEHTQKKVFATTLVQTDLSLFTSFEEYVLLLPHSFNLVNCSLQQGQLYAVYVGLSKEVSIRSFYPDMNKKAALYFYQLLEAQREKDKYAAIMSSHNEWGYTMTKLDYLVRMATIKALFQNYDYVLNSEQKMYIQMAREEVFTPFGHSVMLFWDKYSSRFCNHLDRRLVISFIVHSRTENPLFEMKGRTYKSVLRHAQEWEAEREHTRTVQKKSNIKVWKGANYQDFKKDFALGGKKGRKITYTITQITDSVELREEGYQMQHCVGSYLDKCMEGYCSIWSLRQTEKGGIVSTLVTIEVSASRRIVQARTSYNAIPSDNHQAFIKEWAKNANLICDFEF